MSAIFSFGEYLKNPSSVAGPVSELLSPDFWSRESDKETIDEAIDRLLTRWTLQDYERALEWFGEGQLAPSQRDLIRLSHRRAASGCVCRDHVLNDVLASLDAFLGECEDPRSLAGTVAPADGVPLTGLTDVEIANLGKIVHLYLPIGSLIKTATGQGKG
jgi:hypothetical protein